MATVNRITRKQKRNQRQEGIETESVKQLKPFAIDSTIKPKTENQKLTIESWENGDNLMLHGVAGTGKTFLALWLATKEILQPESIYQKIFIVRSVVPTRDMGFLPGSQSDKTKVYEGPYYDIYRKLFHRGDAYDILKQRNQVEFMSTSFIRGITLDNCILIVDEYQNLNNMELHSIMTRVGENCKIIFSGDIKQDDLTNERKKEFSGAAEFMRIIDKMPEFDIIEFGVEDIVRSALVRSYIIHRDKLGL